VMSGRLFSLEALTESFPVDAVDAELAYAQSIDFVGFLLSRHGRPAFHRLIAELRRGTPFLLAMEEATEEAAMTIEDAWHQDLKLRFSIIPVLTGSTLFWLLASLVFVWAYVKKRRARQRAFARMPDDPGWEEPGAEGDDAPPPPDRPTLH